MLRGCHAARAADAILGAVGVGKSRLAEELAGCHEVLIGKGDEALNERFTGEGAEGERGYRGRTAPDSPPGSVPGGSYGGGGYGNPYGRGGYGGGGYGGGYPGGGGYGPPPPNPGTPSGRIP